MVPYSRCRRIFVIAIIVGILQIGRCVRQRIGAIFVVVVGFLCIGWDRGDSKQLPLGVHECVKCPAPNNGPLSVIIATRSSSHSGGHLLALSS